MRTILLASLVGFALLAVTVCGRDAPTVDVHVKVDPGIDPAVLLGGGIDVEPLFARPAAALLADRTDPGVPDLTRWFRVRVPRSEAATLAASLLADPGVDTAFVAPEPQLPSLVLPTDAPTDGPSCPIRTPSYAPYQGYLSVASAGGIDVPAAWARPGGRGTDMWFADIEGGWNPDHEDLPGDRITHVAGRPFAERGRIAHGTAVLGEVVGLDNGLGVVGIAPDVERVFTASIGGISTAAAIDLAQARLRPGDVLLIELHGIGKRGVFVPMEYWDDVYDAIKLATSRGVVVIEAAGNGAEDLDHPAYAGAFDRRRRDSGAILVGAGAPARTGWTDRSRLDFSNYGSRVDVQGWGRQVATLDYGDLQSCTERGERNYTDRFGGTSSASPIVAGAAILIQAVAKAELGRPLTPAALRARLVATGTPQVDGPHGPATQHIGPRPDLARALRDLGDPGALP